MPVPEHLHDLWRQQSVWSQSANRMKYQITRARTVALALTVSAALMAALAGGLAGLAPTASRILVALAAFTVAAAQVLRPAWSGRKLRDWTRARSVSEALKSEIYLWLAQAGEYAGDTDGRRLTARAAKVRSDGADLLRYQSGIRAEHRDLPAVTDLPSYFAVRVEAQIKGYYRLRAERLHRSLRRYRVVEVGLTLIGALIGASAASTGAKGLIPWIAVLTTVTTALAVHVTANRSEFQLIEFLRTADRLEQLRTQAAVATPDELSALAVAAEDVISIENEAWMAKLAEDPPGPQ